MGGREQFFRRQFFLLWSWLLLRRWSQRLIDWRIICYFWLLWFVTLRLRWQFARCHIYLAMFHKEGILRETRFMSNRLQVMLCCIWRLALNMSFVLFIEDVFLGLTINKIRWTCLLEECCACCVVTITGMEHIIVCCKN